MIRSICASLRDVIADRPYAARVAGLVQTIRRKTTARGEGATKLQMVPADCGVDGADCADGVYTYLLPDSNKGSVLFFKKVRGGETRLVEEGARINKYEATIRLCGWLHLDRLGLSQTNTCEGPKNSTRIWNELLPLFPNQVDMSGTCPLIDVSVRFMREVDESPWEEWPDVKEEVRQFLVLPYEAFVIELKVTWKASPSCIEPLIIGEPFVCGGPPPGPRPPLPVDDCQYIRVCGTPTEGQIIVRQGGEWVFADPSGGAPVYDTTTNPGYLTIPGVGVIPIISE